MKKIDRLTLWLFFHNGFWFLGTENDTIKAVCVLIMSLSGLCFIFGDIFVEVDDDKSEKNN